MPEHSDKIKVNALPKVIRQPVEDFSGKLTEILGGNLESITVVGSSLTEDYLDGRSDINTVLVVRDRPLEAAKQVAGMGRTMRGKPIAAPLIMSRRYIERSRDVFCIELLDLQLNHKTIFGADPFADLIFEKTHVRLQCERELKASLVRLRQGYIAAAGRTRLVREVVAAAAHSLIPLLRAMLWLKDHPRPILVEDVIAKAAGVFSFDPDMLMAANMWRVAKVRIDKELMDKALRSIYKTVDSLAEVVDKLE